MSIFRRFFGWFRRRPKTPEELAAEAEAFEDRRRFETEAMAYRPRR